MLRPAVGHLLEQNSCEVILMNLTYSRRDIDRHNPVTQLLLLLVGNCVSDDQVAQLALVDLVDRIATEDTVGHDGNGSGCAVLDDDVSGFAKGSAGVCHVVDDDSCTTLDIADENHAADFVRTSTLLVNESELDVEAVCDCSCSEIAVLAKMPPGAYLKHLYLTSSLHQRRVRR